MAVQANSSESTTDLRDRSFNNPASTIMQHLTNQLSRLNRFRRNGCESHDYGGSGLSISTHYPVPIGKDGNNCDHRVPGSNWLCHSFGGLAISFKDLIRPITFSQIVRFTHITHLEITTAGYSEVSTTITLEEGRTALKQLNLISFVCTDCPHSLIVEIVFGTSDEIAMIMKQSESPTASTIPGALFAWSTTLEHFKIISDGLLSRNTSTIHPIHLFTLMSRVSWPALTHYQLAHLKEILPFDSDSMNCLRQFLTQRSLPSLTVLEFGVIPTNESVNEVVTILNASIKHEFCNLQHLDIRISSRDPVDYDLNVTHLRGSPPLPFCSPNLTTITIEEECTLKWLKAVSASANLTSLSIQGRFHPDVNEGNFFEAIHLLLIRTLELPFFNSATVESTPSSPDTAAASRIREYFSQMVALTQLSLIHCNVNLPYEQNEWLYYLHHLPSLTSLSCQLNLDAAKTENDHDRLSQPMKYPPQMLAAIARITNLTSLVLEACGSKVLEEFNRVWLERISTSGAPPLPLRTLRFLNLTLDADSPPHMFQLVHQLRHFTRLTDLTIQVGWYESPDPDSFVAESFYRDLDQCRSLRSLRILGYDNLHHRMDDATLLHWCNNGDDPSSGVVGEVDAGDGWSGSPKRVVDGSATKFRELELLEFYNSNFEDESILSLYALPRLRHLIWSGHRGHSELYKHIDDKNRRLIQQSCNHELKTSEANPRPPMHLGYQLPVKIDCITRIVT